MKINIFAMIFIINISSSWSQICGSTVNTSWKYTIQKITLHDVKIFEEKICIPEGPYPGANIKLELMDKSGKVLFTRYAHFIFQRISHSEDEDKKDVAILKWEDFKIIKFPQFPNFEKVKKFKIQGTGDIKIQAEGDLKI